jgi:MFS family permease
MGRIGLSRLAPPGTLLRDPSFALFWGAHAISEAGSRITYVVAPMLVYDLTGSAVGTGVLAALQAVPYLLFGLIAGAIADRADRRRLMVGCNLLQTVILASVPVAAAAGALGVAQVFVVAILSATLFVWFDAANFGALPLIAGRDRLVEANAAVSGASSLIAVAGPAVAGVLAATIGPAYAIGFDAVSYGVSAIALLLVRAPFSTRHLDAASVEPVVRRLVSDVREGLRFLWGHRLVRALTLLGFGISFTGGAVTGLTVVYGVRALGLPDTGAGIGLLFSAAAAGSLVSSLMLPRLDRRFATGSITLTGLTAAVFAVAALAFATNFVAALVFFFAWGAAQTLVIINAISLRQRVAPDHLQSRVNVSARMIAWGGMPFGAAVGGALAEVTSIQTTYLVMAVGVAISAVMGWFSPLRSSRARGGDPSAHGCGQANSQT